VRVPSLLEEHVVILDDYQQTGEEALRVMSMDVMFGRVRPRGRFDMLRVDVQDTEAEACGGEEEEDAQVWQLMIGEVSVMLG
jgi:hypothetical protein